MNDATTQPSSGPPYLRITDLTKKFGDFTALKDISFFSVHQGVEKQRF